MSKSQIGVYVDKELKDRLVAIAQKQNRSLTNLVVTILLDFVQKDSEEKTND